MARMTKASGRFDPYEVLPRSKAVALHEVKVHEQRVSRGFLTKLRRVAPKIPFASDLVSVWYCARDPETPTTAKAMLMAALAYFVIPSDAIPDVLAGLGYADDAAVIAAVLTLVGRNLKPRHKDAAKALLDRIAKDA